MVGSRGIVEDEILALVFAHQSVPAPCLIREQEKYWDTQLPGDAAERSQRWGGHPSLDLTEKAARDFSLLRDFFQRLAKAAPRRANSFP